MAQCFYLSQVRPSLSLSPSVVVDLQISLHFSSIMTIAGWHRPKTWYNYAADHLRTAHEKQAEHSIVLAFFFCLCSGPASLPIVAIFYALVDARWSTSLMAIWALLSSVTAVHIWVTKRQTLSIVLFYAITPYILLLDLSFGAGAQSPAVLSISHMGPLFIVLLDHANFHRGLLLELVLIAVSLTTTTLEQSFAPQRLTPQPPLPSAWQAACSWACCMVPGLINLIFVKFVIWTVADSRRQTEELNDKLLQHKQQLELQQSLTRNLIGNVFPESVCKALIDLFEQSSKSIQSSVQLVGATLADRVARSATESYLTPAALMAHEAGTSHHMPLDCDTMSRPGAKYMVSCKPPNAVEAETASVASPSSSQSSLRSSVAAAVSPSTRGMVDSIADSLAPKLHRSAAVLFADIVGFTTMASVTPPTTLVHFLDTLFGRIDEVCQARRVEKIKTIGDCYMCVGWPDAGADEAASAWNVLMVAKEMHRIVATIPLGDKHLAMRAGMHVGLVVSGIIGRSKFAFDIWGDTVNLASRMESTGVPGATQVTSCVYELLKAREAFVLRGPVDVKGKGQVTTYMFCPSEAAGSSKQPASRSSRHFNVVEMLLAWITQASSPREGCGTWERGSFASLQSRSEHAAP